MNLSIKRIILFIFLIILSFIAGRNMAPEKVKIEKVVEVKEVVVYKENMSREINENLVIKEIIIEKKNGDKITTRNISKKTNENSLKSISNSSVKSKKKLTKILKISKKRHTLSVFLLNPSLNSSFQAQNLGIYYQNNLFMGITAGAGVTASKSFILSLGINF